MNTEGIILGSVMIAAIVFIPGYALVRGLFDSKKLGFIWMLTLSFFLGLTPPLLIYALNKNLSIPLTTQTALLSAGFITIAGIVLWFGKKGK